MEDKREIICEIIKEILLVDPEEIESEDLYELAWYAEAKQKGYTKNNFLKYKPKVGADGQMNYKLEVILILLECEKQFSIAIKDEDAEKINTIDQLLNHLTA